MSTSKNHLLTGKQGEEIALQYLKEKGYTIVVQNYRYKRSEIDIVAILGSLLVFIEVKTRTSQWFGEPEESINQKKYEAVTKAADHYIAEAEWENDIRFDVISILIETTVTIHHIEDAFY